jgi:hypothetical protein
MKKRILDSAWFENRIMIVKVKGRFGRLEYYMGIDSGKSLPREDEENYVIENGHQLNPNAMVHFFKDERIKKQEN